MHGIPFFLHGQKSARLHLENWLQLQQRFCDEGRVIVDVGRVIIRRLLVIFSVVIDDFYDVFCSFHKFFGRFFLWCELVWD